MIDPSPELPDDTSIKTVKLPSKIKRALLMTGLRTVGEIRETPDIAILQIKDLGESSLALLREKLGLPSSQGVRSGAIQKQTKSEA
jgi:hypothetical protein